MNGPAYEACGAGATRPQAEPSERHYCIVSSLQAGAERGALLGIEDARSTLRSAGDAASRLRTCGFAPLGYRCDDYIQHSDIDDKAGESIRQEEKSLKMRRNPEVRNLIKQFNVQELAEPDHQVRSEPKDRANVHQSDVVVAFRSPVPAVCPYVEKTVNYSTFGMYNIVEQCNHGEAAGGALQRGGLLASEGWPKEHRRQMVDASCAEFQLGTDYLVMDAFTHTTAKDERKSDETGKDVYVTRVLCQHEMLATHRKWTRIKARKAAIVFTLNEGKADADGDGNVAMLLQGFLRRSAGSCKAGQPLRVMVTGVTELSLPGVQERVQRIFQGAFVSLLTSAGGGGAAASSAAVPSGASAASLDEPRGACFHVSSGLQVGADRGALLGVKDIWDSKAHYKNRLFTGGYAPLGYKCDDYIQSSDIDPEANENIEKEKAWIKGPINTSVRDLIDKFGVKECPNENHKVKFPQKDKANADMSDVLVAFRSLAPNSGAGTEQTVNYAAFGTYLFVEQFRNGEDAGGAVQRMAFIQQAGWPPEHVKQLVNQHCIEFKRGEEYLLLDQFVHATPKDEAKSAEKGKDVFQMRALTQKDLLDPARKWTRRTANRSCIVFTLGEQEAEDSAVTELLEGFLWLHRSQDQQHPLRVTVSGPTEAVMAGVQERVRKIFFNALTRVLQRDSGADAAAAGNTTGGQEELPPSALSSVASSAGGRRHTVHRYHLISGLQVGADRGALLGIEDVWANKSEEEAARISTGGFAPLGYKCDDYIQESDIDPLANPSIEGEKKWLDGPINQEVRGMIEKFGVKELPNEQHKVKFAAKDMANADACDVLVAFRSWAPNSGAGTEQTVNYGVFGEYIFAEQFRNGDKAGGALQRVEFLAQEGWPAEHTEQSVHSQCIEFKGGQEYSVVQTFTHETPKDEQKSAEKGKPVFKMQAVTQADLLSSSRTWARRAAKRSAIVFTLAEEASGDDKFTEELADFLRRHGKEREPLKIMVSGPTEKVAPGTQDRARAIFKGALSKLL